MASFSIHAHTFHPKARHSRNIIVYTLFVVYLMRTLNCAGNEHSPSKSISVLLNTFYMQHPIGRHLLPMVQLFGIVSSLNLSVAAAAAHPFGLSRFRSLFLLLEKGRRNGVDFMRCFNVSLFDVTFSFLKIRTMFGENNRFFISV